MTLQVYVSNDELEDYSVGDTLRVVDRGVRGTRKTPLVLEPVLTRTKIEETMSAAWNRYVFARAGQPAGYGMAVESEPVAFAALSEAFFTLTSEWDER